MKTKYWSEWALAGACVYALSTGTALAHQDVGPILMPKPKPKPASATLLVMCDIACTWKLDGEVKGIIAEGGVKKVPISLGQHIVDAATGDGQDRLEKEVDLERTGQTILRIQLKPIRDARLKAAQEAADRTAREEAERQRAAQQQADRATQEQTDQQRAAQEQVAREQAKRDAAQNASQSFVVTCAALPGRSTLSLSREPGNFQMVVDTVRCGSRVAAVASGENGRFYQMLGLNGTLGWLDARYLLTSSDSRSARHPDTDGMHAAVSCLALDARRALFIYASPDSSETVGTLPCGASVTIVNQSDDTSWYQVNNSQGTTGWIQSRYLSF